MNLGGRIPTLVVSPRDINVKYMMRHAHTFVKYNILES